LAFNDYYFASIRVRESKRFRVQSETSVPWQRDNETVNSNGEFVTPRIINALSPAECLATADGRFSVSVGVPPRVHASINARRARNKCLPTQYVLLLRYVINPTRYTAEVTFGFVSPWENGGSETKTIPSVTRAAADGKNDVQYDAVTNGSPAYLIISSRSETGPAHGSARTCV